MTFKIEYNDRICKTERKKTSERKGVETLNRASGKDLTFVSSVSQKKQRKKTEVKKKYLNF